MTYGLPAALQVVGIVLLLVAAVVFVASGVQSLLFVAAGMVLIVMGAYLAMVQTHRALESGDEA